MVKRQKTSITQFFRPNQSRILQGDKLKRLLMYKMIVDLEPFSSVEAEGLKSTLEYDARPNASVVITHDHCQTNGKGVQCQSARSQGVLGS